MGVGVRADRYPLRENIRPWGPAHRRHHCGGHPAARLRMLPNFQAGVRPPARPPAQAPIPRR